MAFTYSGFKSYLQTFLWKDNDTVVTNNLDNLIQMADNELNRVLDISRRDVTSQIAPETEDYVLPSAFRQIHSLVNNANPPGTLEQTTVAHVYEIRARSDSDQIVGKYAIDLQNDGSKYLRLIGPFSASDPGDMTLRYRSDVPDFETDDASYLAEDYLDLYTYTVLKHSAPFLREDERIPVWQNAATQALASAIDEDKRFIAHGGVPNHMQAHHPIPRRSRRR